MTERIEQLEQSLEDLKEMLETKQRAMDELMRVRFIIVEVKTKCQNVCLIFENDHSKLRILVYSRLENQRI